MFARVLSALLLALVSFAADAAVKIQHWSLANGARVYFVEAHQIPMLQMAAVFDAGSARGADKPGLPMLTNDMLTQGAGNWDTTQIAQRLEGVGADLSTGSDRDTASIGLRTLSSPKALATALDIFATVLRDPTFPQKSLDRERNLALASLQREKQSPGAVASKAFFKAVYADYPYGVPGSGTEAGLKSLTRADLVDFHHRYYVGANALFVIVGDASPEQAHAIAEQIVGRLPKGAPAPALAAPPENRPSVQRIDFPSKQTHILVGGVGIARNDPDYFPLLVGNYILGGSGLISRLALEIREKYGLSYSVYSYFYPLKEAGPFVMGLQTKNSQRDEALRMLHSVLAKFLQEGPTAKELEDAKRHLTGSFPLRIDSSKKIVDYLAVIGFYHLPLDYLDRFDARVNAVTLDQIRAAFKRHVHPKDMVTVVVGAGA